MDEGSANDGPEVVFRARAEVAVEIFGRHFSGGVVAPAFVDGLLATAALIATAGREEGVDGEFQVRVVESGGLKLGEGIDRVRDAGDIGLHTGMHLGMRGDRFGAKSGSKVSVASILVRWNGSRNGTGAKSWCHFLG